MPRPETLSIEPDALRSVLALFPSGVVVVTAETASGCVGLTVQSFMALSLEPSLVLLSIARTSTSWPAIKDSGNLAINVLGAPHADVATAFARSGGPKFDSCDWHPGPTTGSPVLTAATAWIEAEIWQLYDGGDHEIVAARVVDMGVTDGDPSPLLFFKSKFSRLACEPGVAQQ
ncbi:flavin reductase family protein [Rhodococcus koreensis]